MTGAGAIPNTKSDLTEKDTFNPSIRKKDLEEEESFFISRSLVARDLRILVYMYPPRPTDKPVYFSPNREPRTRPKESIHPSYLYFPKIDDR
jgi:hypothetical protein